MPSFPLILTTPRDLDFSTSSFTLQKRPANSWGKTYGKSMCCGDSAHETATAHLMSSIYDHAKGTVPSTHSR
jgi:hypothetical protein